MNYLIKLTAIVPAICFNPAKIKFLKLCQKNPPVQVSKFVVQKKYHRSPNFAVDE